MFLPSNLPHAVVTPIDNHHRSLKKYQLGYCRVGCMHVNSCKIMQTRTDTCCVNSHIFVQKNICIYKKIFAVFYLICFDATRSYLYLYSFIE